MDIEQLEAVTEIQRLLYHGGLIATLGSYDMRFALSVDEKRTLITLLLAVFFFGAAIPFEFAWHSNHLETYDWIGVTVTENRNGQDVECISIHPTKVIPSVGDSPNYNRALAVQRLSTLMHELIHAVIKTLCCRECRAADDNLAHHGRTWQRLALGVETEFAKFFGLSLDLGRMDGVLNDMVSPGAEFRYPSRHDLEIYGFVEPR